jgi:hypothetical protein
MSQGFVNGYKRLSPFLRLAQNGKVVQFWCPGCDDDHQVVLEGPNKWEWNGDFILPTFSPSIKVEKVRTTKDEHGRWNGGWVLNANNESIDEICHSYVRDGMIEYLGDCTHALVNTTVRISEWYTHETEGLPGRPPKD